MFKRELLKNKLYALLLILIGFLSIFIEYDATVFVFMLMIGLPLFFAKENWITDNEYYDDEEEYSDELSEDYVNQYCRWNRL